MSQTPAERDRAARLWRLYGLTPDAWAAMWDRQAGRCAICERHDDELPTPGGRRRRDGSAAEPPSNLVVDHDHARAIGETGFLRSLLCRPCNLIVGHAEATPPELRAALVGHRVLDYLERHAA